MCDGACEPADADGPDSDARVFATSLARARKRAAADANAAALHVATRSRWWEVDALCCGFRHFFGVLGDQNFQIFCPNLVVAVASAAFFVLGCLGLLVTAPFYAARHRERVSFVAFVTTRRLITSEAAGVDLCALPGPVRVTVHDVDDIAAAEASSEGCCCEGTSAVSIFNKDPFTGQRRIVEDCCGNEHYAPRDSAILFIKDAGGLAAAIELARRAGGHAAYNAAFGAAYGAAYGRRSEEAIIARAVNAAAASTAAAIAATGAPK